MRTIAHISDLHFGRHDPSVVEALLADLHRSGSDLVIISGDFTQRARREEFTAAKAFLARLKLPMLVIPGNHDVAPVFRPLTRMFRPMARYERFVARDREPVFVDSEIAVLGLDTARRAPGKNGRVSREQMATIRRVLGPLPDHLFKILVTHHPLAVPRLAGALELAGRARRALEAADDAGVSLLLSGHYHRWASGETIAHVARQRSVLVVHAGTAVSTRTRGGEANSYNLIRLDGERLEVTVIGWQTSDRFAEVGTARFRLGSAGWTLEQAGGDQPAATDA